MEDTDKKDSNCCLRVVRKLQAPKIEEDEVGKAKSFRLFSIARPHMRGFHSSWFCFFIAFTAWFGIQPLIPTIRKELCLSKQEVAHSGTASISATIFVRIVVGPLCDMFGPRRVMSGLLIIGAIPLGFAGFIKDGTGLIIVRLFIGILGGTFIPCQFWTSAMFNAKIVGTANALVGGWGNLGGGFTFLLMPGLFELVQVIGADEFLAWKIAVVIPAMIVLGMGTLVYNLQKIRPGRVAQSVHSASGSMARAPGIDTLSGHTLSLLLPLIQEGQLSVNGESMCMRYWLTA